jgi:hypothetical protein
LNSYDPDSERAMKALIPLLLARTFTKCLLLDGLQNTPGSTGSRAALPGGGKVTHNHDSHIMISLNAF